MWCAGAWAGGLAILADGGLDGRRSIRNNGERLIDRSELLAFRVQMRTLLGDRHCDALAYLAALDGQLDRC